MDNSHDESSSDASIQESTGSNQIQEELALVEIQDDGASADIQQTESDDLETQVENDEADKDQDEQENENVEGAHQAAVKQSQFALSRIKTIMKLDPDLALASKESVMLIAKATVRTFLALFEGI